MTQPNQAAPATAKKKMNRADLMFKQKNGETLIKVPGQVTGRAFAISNLENCKVYLYDHTAQVSPMLVMLLDLSILCPNSYLSI